MNLLLIKLLTAHFIGDFLLQPSSWVAEKEIIKLKSLKLYYHILIHGALVLLLTFDLSYWPQAAAIMLLHGGIDALKLCLQKPSTKRPWFFADQLLHFSSIGALWYFTARTTLNLGIDPKRGWITMLAVLACTYPASIAIKVLIAKWTPVQLAAANGGVPSLESAGKFIGIIERLLVLLLVYTGHWDTIGFLIAAKSIFRFGDLKEGSDLKLTEYILIGTLLSFSIAIGIAVLSLGLMDIF